MNLLLAPVLFLVAGLALGSFGNVLIARVPEGKSITGRSRCMRCVRTLGVSELVPVLSFLVQGGKCRGCKEAISLQYPLIESVSALLFLLALALVPGSVAGAFFLGVALWMLLLIAAVDIKSRMIPDVFSGLFLLAAVIAGVALHGRIDVLAVLVGAGFFFLQWLVSRGKWVGTGDIPVAAGIGLVLGSWQLMVFSLAASYIVGCFAVLPGLASGRLKQGDHLAFVPFLFIGFLIALLWGGKFLEALGL